MGSAIADLQLDDESLRITRWRLPPGSEIGWHRHQYDYVVVPITDGTLTIVDAAGRHPFEVCAGRSYARKAGVEHDVANDTASEVTFVEIEMKRGLGSP